MKKLVVWYNPNKNIYYYRFVRGIFYESYSYDVGQTNSFGHIIVLVISYDELKLNLSHKYSYTTLKTRTLSRLISFLKKLL